MECCCYLRNVQDLLADGKTQTERRFGESSEGPIIPFGARVEYLSNSERRSESSSIRIEGITRIFFYWICFDRGENLERRYSDRWYWRIGKIGCIRNFSQMIECKRSPENTNRRRICISCGRWYGKIIRKGLRVPRTPLPRREQTGGEIHGDREESQPAEQKDESEARKDFWSFQEISSTVITLNREFNFMYQKKKHSPFQWNTLVSQGPLVQIWTLPGSWNGSTRFTLLIETPPNGYTWSGRRLTKIQTTSRRLDESWKSRSKKREARMGNRETKIRIYQKFEENLFYWSEWWR